MARPKVDDFLNLVRRSGLVDRDQLNRLLLKLKEQAGGKPINDTDFVGDQLVDAELITRWQCQKLMEGRHKGFFLGKYRLLDHLGTGGMSSVYLAEHVLMQRRVAVKVLPKTRVEDSSYLERFHREAQASATLDHRNIVRAYDVDNDGDIHYLVMEYIEGRDLQTMVKQDGPLEYAAAADYIRQAALGLAHAHQAGLIHRDVKPANLLVDTNGVVKLLDLGLARFTGEDRASLTVAYDENVLGTADYLAPEQALDSHGVDARADIYSLGCSFYFLLTGRPPFPDGTLPQRLMMHQKHPPPSIRQTRPDAPEDLVSICLRMLAKKPSGRYQSAAEAADALADWLTAHGHAVDSGSGSSSGRLAAAAAGMGEWVRAKRIGSPPSPAGGGKPGSGSGIRPAGSLKPLEPTPAGDTLAHRDHPTTAGPGSSPRQAFTSGQSDPKLGTLPVAKPIDEQPAVPNLQIQADSSVVDRLKRRQRPGTKEERGARRLRLKGIPTWAWATIGAGGILALVLLMLLLF